jgi:ATP-binding cassette, subfamily D (ALD), peroxisomal long-chain fatty acid import protein
LNEYGEEVAFYGGENVEKMFVEREYATVLKHENKVLRRRWWFGCVEEGVIKWLWGSFGVRILTYITSGIVIYRW